MGGGEVFAASLAGAALATLLHRRGSGPCAGGTVRSTASSGTAGAAVYESSRAVEEYLAFHFGAPEDQMPWDGGPTAALRFMERAAAKCAAARGTGSALDLGCAVGGGSFELARRFASVKGVDFSEAFVRAAKDLQAGRELGYRLLESGARFSARLARAPEGVDLGRVSFEVGDACALPPSLGPFDAVLCCNLLCRLPEPQALLQRLPTLVAPGGVAVLVSPYSWLEEYTPRARWLGGADGKGDSFQDVRRALERDFELVEESDMPFLIREHRRKFQWGCSHASVWRRRG
mmetsp:Transcript_13251/g.45847  ORF Transcript_13251/g.45847 Transcript_13251/m.45847 type:complete len:290 (-) Transcript_13251:133-1002(-)